jgi:hypothetical protein
MAGFGPGRDETERVKSPRKSVGDPEALRVLAVENGDFGLMLPESS